MIAALKQKGIDEDVLAEKLQRDGADAFSISWAALMGRIAAKRQPAAA